MSTGASTKSVHIDAFWPIILIMMIALLWLQWPAIARELGMGRHPSECLARRQRGVGSAPPAKWDAVEDARLQAAVKRHGRNWQVQNRFVTWQFVIA